MSVSLTSCSDITYTLSILKYLTASSTTTSGAAITATTDGAFMTIHLKTTTINSAAINAHLTPCDSVMLTLNDTSHLH